MVSATTSCTDLNGDDTLKGGDGNDALSSGQGFGGDLNQGGRGNDFIVGGNDITETFAGPGDDFVFAGDAEDTVFGDDGDDWIEGGRGPFNLLQGDNGAPFQDDPNEPGHDVLIGDGGEQDYDAEGGDDIMLLGPASSGPRACSGFDWVTHKGDPLPGDSDMGFTGALPPSVETNRDRFDLVEALSGWNFDDILRGDDRCGGRPRYRARADRRQASTGIDGLAEPARAGVTSFTGGNILIGGAGNDLIEGRGGDDIIDGDAWLNVQLRAPNLATPDPATPSWWTTMAALQADVLRRPDRPGRHHDRPVDRARRRGVGHDTAVFSGAQTELHRSRNNADGSVTVAHTGGNGQDGTDTLRGIENRLLRHRDRSRWPTRRPTDGDGRERTGHGQRSPLRRTTAARRSRRFEVQVLNGDRHCCARCRATPRRRRAP